MKTMKFIGLFLIFGLMLINVDAQKATEKNRQNFLVYRGKDKVVYHSNLFTLPAENFSREEQEKYTELKDKFRARILKDYEEKIYVNNNIYLISQMKSETDAEFEERYAEELDERKQEGNTLREIYIN